MADTAVGHFVWHELLTTDVKSAVRYYQHVVNWQTQHWQPGSDYLMWVAKQGPVGGVARCATNDAAPYWLHYLSTADIEATVGETQQLGGKVLAPITQIGNGGCYAVLTDPQGGRFGVYASANAATVNPPALGDFAWHELVTDDHVKAFDFYQALFGWRKLRQVDMGAMGIYQLFGIEGRELGGMFNKPTAMPTAWCCYVQVQDATQAAKLATSAGGKVINGPMLVPGGSWIAQMLDPQGAQHAVVSPAKKPRQANTVSKPMAKVAPKKAAGKTAAKKNSAQKKPAHKKAVKQPSKNKLRKLSAPKNVRVKVSKKQMVKKKSIAKKSTKKKSAAKHK